MNKDKIVIINGKKYDAVTGLPHTEPTPPKKPVHATGVHAAPARSQTLVRRVIKKPVPARKPGHTMDIAKSHAISRFAPHPVVAKKQVAPVSRDIPATRHPILTRARLSQGFKQATTVKKAPPTPREIKDQAITAALAAPKPKTQKKKFFKRHTKLVTILSISIVVAVAVAYIVYLNMPALSVRVAAAQAGINATYPQYQPDGYSLDGPVTFTDGAVSIHFIANTGSKKFDITQAKSSWDSTAVLDNIVTKAAGQNYITNQEQGLTIYTYNGNAAWVNGGILYTITGDAPLSGDQIGQIATSL